MVATSGIEYPRQIALHQVTNSAFRLLNFSKVRRLQPKMTADCLGVWKKYSAAKRMTVKTILTTGDKGRRNGILVLQGNAWHKARPLELSCNLHKLCAVVANPLKPSSQENLFHLKRILIFLKKYFNVSHPHAHIVIVITRARLNVICVTCALWKYAVDWIYVVTSSYVENSPFHD